MIERKWLLRLMLWSLGLAAVMGVVAVLTGTEDLTGRVIGTALLAAVACLMMLATTRMMDKATTRPAGLLGTWTVLVEFLLGLAAIWLTSSAFRIFDDDELFITMVCVAWAAVPAMWLIKLSATPAYRAATRVGLGMCAGYFGISMLATWLPGPYWRHDEWWETAWVLFLANPVFVVTLLGFGVESGRHWRWIGVASGVVACVMALWGIWNESKHGPAGLICVSSVAIVVAMMNIIARCPLKPGQVWLRAATLAAVVATAFVIDVAAIIDPSSSSTEELFFRLGGATGIVSACGLMALAVLARLNRQVDYEPLTGRILEMTLHCPRCDKKQTVQIGDAQCCDCQLRIHTRVEEPRCPGCGYLLYRLTADQCPECGVSLGAAQAHPTM